MDKTTELNRLEDKNSQDLSYPLELCPNIIPDVTLEQLVKLQILQTYIENSVISSVLEVVYKEGEFAHMKLIRFLNERLSFSLKNRNRLQKILDIYGWGDLNLRGVIYGRS